jgi:hypothetical protein
MCDMNDLFINRSVYAMLDALRGSSNEKVEGMLSIVRQSDSSSGDPLAADVMWHVLFWVWLLQRTLTRLRPGGCQAVIYCGRAVCNIPDISPPNFVAIRNSVNLQIGRLASYQGRLPTKSCAQVTKQVFSIAPLAPGCHDASRST